MEPTPPIPLERARRQLAAGELAEVRKLLASTRRAPPSTDKFAGLVLLAEAEMLSNTMLELVGTLAVARRTARQLERPDLERRVRLLGVASTLLLDRVPAEEVAQLRAEGLRGAEKGWLDAMAALVAAREGRVDDADALLGPVRVVAASGGPNALRILPWVVRTELALGRSDDAQRTASTGEWMADALGMLAHRDALARMARGAAQATSPQVQEAVLGLVDLASATAGGRDLRALFRQVATATLELLEVDRAFVVLSDRDGGLKVGASLGRKGEASGHPSKSLIERALRTGLPVVSNDLDRDGTSRSASIVSMGLRSVICAPMLDGAHALGVIYGDSERVTEHELQKVAWLARGIAGVAAVAVANAHRLDDAEQRSQEGREIAHDVRNLLSSVLLSSEDIGEADDVPAWARRVADQAKAATVQMRKHLDQLLSRTPQERVVVRLDTLASELVVLLDRLAKARSVRFDLQLDEVEISAQPGELGRALTNLVSNALKYSPEAGVVSLRVAALDRVARFEVSDQGPGIPADQLQAIFDSGVQARGAVEGLGLGLGIAARVVGDHGGRVWAENLPHGGARFIVELPLS